LYNVYAAFMTLLFACFLEYILYNAIVSFLNKATFGVSVKQKPCASAHGRRLRGDWEDGRPKIWGGGRPMYSSPNI